MNQIHRFLTSGLMAACLLSWIGMSALADDAKAESGEKPTDSAATAKETAPPSAAAEKPVRELTPAQIALRDRVRRTLASYQGTSLNTRDNTPSEILQFCLAYGCSGEVAFERPGGNRINAIAALCYYPCAGYEMLGLSQGHVAARIGYGYQERPGEFLAMLALSRVPSDYPIRVGKTQRTVADVVEAEKLGYRGGGGAPLKLIGLSYYVDESEWKNDLGETWSIGRILDEELEQSATAAARGNLDRLLGLGYAVSRREKNDSPIPEAYRRAEKYVSDFHQYAIKLQNSDGSWGPAFPAAGVSSDPGVQLQATGRVLEWLVLTLPERRLDETQVSNAVECVNRLLGSRRFQWNSPSLSAREIAAMGRALHALAVFDERVFQPADPVQQPAAAAASSAKADGEVKKY